MKPVCSFIAKFASVISWDLACFDRVIFKGHLPISRAAEFERFVDGTLKIRRADFLEDVGPKWSERLVEHSKQFAHEDGRPWEYYAGAIDKDAWAKKQLGLAPVAAGLVGVLCVMEACPTFKLASGKDRPVFVARKVPQRVLYYYFVDKELGLMHVRLQTWAPSASLGGAIYMSAAILNITSSTFTGNSATSSGGAIYVVTGTVNLSGNTFSGNKATKFGGAIYVSSGTATSSDDTFDKSSGSGNSAQSGGAIYVANGTLSITGDSFSNNSATGSGIDASGGAIYAKGGTITASQSTFSGNSCTWFGEAIFAGNATITLTSDTSSGNTTSKLGGAVYIDLGTLKLVDDTFFGNTATNGGGAVYDQSATVTATNSTFNSNSAAEGGGFYLRSGGNLTLNSDTIAGNKATATGGGLYVFRGTVTSFNTILDGNTATNKDADVYLSGGNTFTSSGGNLFGEPTLRVLVACSPKGGHFYAKTRTTRSCQGAVWAAPAATVATQWVLDGSGDLFGITSEGGNLGNVKRQKRYQRPAPAGTASQ